MADGQVDYQAVLADLESRRATFNRATDAAISSIRQILSLTTGVVDFGSVGSSPSGATPIDAEGFFGLGLIDAAKKYLRLSRRKLSNKEISDGLDKAGFVHTSKDFTNTVGTALWRAVKEGDAEIFRQGRFWLLSEWAPGRRRTVSLKPSDSAAPGAEGEPAEAEGGVTGEEE